MKAILKRQYEGRKKSEAILKSVQPDNLKTPKGIRISSSLARDSIEIRVDCDKGLGTLISTMDDLLSCMSAAERTLDDLD